MLQEIYINNFVLIEEQRLDFSPGLNVLTGETGAGKSIIMDAMGLVLGERSKNDYVRDANKKAIVEAVFELQPDDEAYLFLQEQDLIEADFTELVLCREIYPNGRNAARINGRNVTINTLKTLGSLMVDMQSQNDRNDFLLTGKYLDYVDGFADVGAKLLPQVDMSYAQIKSFQEQIAKMEASQQLRAQRTDFLKFQVKEIEDGQLREGEEEELKGLRERVRNAAKFLAGSNQMLDLLYSSEQGTSAYDQIASVMQIAAELKTDIVFAELHQELASISYSLQDMSGQLSAFRDTLEFEPDRLEKIDDRLYLIGKLKQKYGASIKDILAFLDQSYRELEALEHSEERQDELHEALRLQQAEYFQLAGELTQRRQKAALLLAQRVTQELSGLNMPDIRFRIEITSLSQLGIKGMDEADFLFSSNPGEELRPVSRIASGGEISRLILALKIALSDLYQVPTLIFDEIDVGLGGTALIAMAEKISQLSKQHQLILVTHSPQLAGYAQQHLLIDKYVENERTFTSVIKLDAEARVKELARMLDGENYSELTLEHARELLSKS